MKQLEDYLNWVSKSYQWKIRTSIKCDNISNPESALVIISNSTVHSRDFFASWWRTFFPDGSSSILSMFSGDQTRPRFISGGIHLPLRMRSCLELGGILGILMFM